MYLKEFYNNVCIGKLLFRALPLQNGLKQVDALLPLLFNFTLEYAIVRETLTENIEHMVMSCHQNTGQNHKMKIDNNSFRDVSEFSEYNPVISQIQGYFMSSQNNFRTGMNM
jgi:hypothetical protein